MNEFLPGKSYRRRAIHQSLGGQNQGGISTPTSTPAILLFTGQSGEQYGYNDGWTQDGVFLYFGEGQYGNMEFVRGNRAIRDHIINGKDLLLFEQERKAWVKFVGHFVCSGYHHVRSPDLAGAIRNSIVFELLPTHSVDLLSGLALAPSNGENLESLRRRALSESSQQSTISERIQIVRERSAAIRAYALGRAAGDCENCGNAAPFSTPSGQPYLEVHHLRRLSDGGPDHPEWVAAICPNCHRCLHYGAHSDYANERLAERVRAKER